MDVPYLVLILIAIATQHLVGSTPSNQYKAPLNQRSKLKSVRAAASTKQEINLSSNEEGDSRPEDSPRRRGNKRTTTVTIKSCNANFCDPGWEPYPNIVSSVTGYNILKGNAYNLGTEQDPGFETGYIFVPVVKDDDDRYALHGGITVRAISKCDLSLNTRTVSTVKQYQNINREVEGNSEGWKTNPPVEISVEGKGVGASTELPPLFEAFGTANKALRNHEEFFTKRQGVLTVNDATCALYAMQISRRYPPPFQQSFKNAVLALGAAVDDTERKEEFHKFIEEFGTHFLQKATIGARLSIVRRYSRGTFKRATEEEIENCNKFRLGYFYVKEEGGNNCTNLENAGESMIFNNIHREQIISYGSKPSDSLTDWANQEFDSPVPIKMKLTPTLELFHKDFMQRDEDLKWSGYATIREWMTPLYNSYCEDMKAALGIEFCRPGDIKRCGYNDECNPAFEDCVQTAVNDYECMTKVTKSYVSSLINAAMDNIKDGMKAGEVAYLIEKASLPKLHGFELYVFVMKDHYGKLQVAGENAILEHKNSFKAAVAWASSSDVGIASQFERDVTQVLNGELCKPFDARKVTSMDKVIKDVNTKGHSVQFFIHGSDPEAANHDNSGASDTKPDYHIMSGCGEKNQYVLIGPGRG